ncbi:MAG: hypothetical protein K9I99_17350 [Melioribacteraceae bacterium]|nr:hypothetical protein [Melioribacteraceae bacterium]
MANIKKLKLRLKSGLLSELQSDTIFGHFAWRLKEQMGEPKLEEFLEYYINGNPIFTISDGVFENSEGEIFFPKPLKLTPPKFNADTKTERLKNFIKQKESKSRNHVKLNELNLYLTGDVGSFDESLATNNKLKSPAYNKELRVSVEIDREKFSSKDGQLFSYYPKYVEKNTFLTLFIKVFNQELWKKFDASNVLKSVFEIGFGKKKSSGYGVFEIMGELEDFNKFSEPADPNGFITLSHYLPADNDNIMDAYYDINLKYGKFGEQFSNQSNPFKNPLILLRPGSCFITKTRKEFYGRAVNNLNDYFPKAIQNGIAFTLGAKL